MRKARKDARLALSHQKTSARSECGRRLMAGPKDDTNSRSTCAITLTIGLYLFYLSNYDHLSFRLGMCVSFKILLLPRLCRILAIMACSS